MKLYEAYKVPNQRSTSLVFNASNFLFKEEYVIA